jgi:SAM-dependent methyltransferase
MKETERFTERAQAYAAGRPDYPDEAIEALFAGLGDPREVVAVDLGAGTGISARLLAARGAQVLAVEPNAAMRDAADHNPNVRWIDGTAEHTGLEEAVADLAVAFQAFHWFDAEAALDEIVRIVRPAGRAALVYYERDESDPFTAGWGEITHRFATDDTERRRAVARERFALFPAWHEFRRIVVPHVQRLDREGVRRRIDSTSYLPHQGPAGEAVRREIEALVERYQRHGQVELALSTLVLIGDLGADGA